MVDEKLYKHRLYYKTVWKKNMPILTFIMFNPSTANQYSTDPTISNCIKLAQKGVEQDGKKIEFGGIEIYNLITIRHPSVIKTMELYKEEEDDDDDNDNPLFNDDFKDKHICLAWGGKITVTDPETLKEYNAIKKKLINEILDKLNENQNLYVYGDIENMQNYTKPRHPSPIAFNTIKNQQLIKINFEELKKLYNNQNKITK